MNILFIGGTRFFGVHAVRELLRRGHQVTIATRGTTLFPSAEAQVSQLSILAEAQKLNGVGIDGSLWTAMQDINLNLFGLNLGEVPSFASWLVIIPILTALSSFASMKLTRKLMGQNPALQGQTPETRTSGIIMDLMMPLMSLWFAFKLPALLGIYWIYQSVLGVVQQYFLSKAMPLPTYTEEEIRAILKAEKEKANANRAAMRQGGYSAKSLHHIDDDDDDDDVYVPRIRSKFDEDDDAPKHNTGNKKK